MLLELLCDDQHSLRNSRVHLDLPVKPMGIELSARATPESDGNEVHPVISIPCLDNRTAERDDKCKEEPYLVPSGHE